MIQLALSRHRKDMTDSINERFKTFISQLPSAEVIDELELPSEFDESKRADFLIENRKT